MNNYKITVLKGDGIGPEIVDECTKVLDAAGEKFGFKFDYNYQLLGGCAIDEKGVPYPKETEEACKASDAVLLGAVGGPKWDSQPGSNRPEAGLLAIRESLDFLQTCALQRYLLRSRVLPLLKRRLSAADLIFLSFVSLQAASISETAALMRKTALRALMTQSVTPYPRLKELFAQALSTL